MTTLPPKKRDWLEPPEWWKKWRPLRWLAGLLVLIAVLSWVQPLFSPGDSARLDERSPAETRLPPGAVVAEDDPDPDGERALVVDAALETSAGKISAAPTAAAEAKPDPVVPPAATIPPAAVAKPPPSAAAPVVAKAPAPKNPEPAPAPGKPPAAAASGTVGAATADAAPPAAAEEDEELTTLEAQQSRDYRAYTERMPNPVVLMSIFRSYSSVDAVYGALNAAKYEPIQESNHSKVRAGVPPRNLDLMRVKGYRHLGAEGTLELQFFNDRLTQAEFEPDADETESYRAALRRSMPQLPRERSGRSEFRDGQLRVASSVDLALSEVGTALRTRPFVLWQDLRLIEQRDTWDQRFGATSN